MLEERGGRVLWYSVGVAVLLIVCILYSGALAAPYNTNGPSYAVAHESTEAFENYVEDNEELQEMSAVPVADLSPETQRAFGEMQSKQPRAGNQYEHGGWQRIGPVSVCHSSLIYCDEYTDWPDFPTEHYIGGGSYTTYGLVENDGDEYLVRTTSGPRLDFGPLLHLVIKVLTLGPYAVFLLLTGFTRKEGTNGNQTTYATVGLGLAGAVLVHPYILMWAGPSSRLFFLSLGILAFVSWGTMLAWSYLRLTSDRAPPR
ncbi:hypothetical protein SAMN04515672_1108 [Natronorubrum texcoconense]|uniref:Uncharacterized protein n=1 Tax=Natronorubrum texcoconense TaxID=1095776 RepID=A0A1G8V1W1_9EURY|nr:hypothetical protein SAMN04515672_1108 [Natronorubrum texcoconense]